MPRARVFRHVAFEDLGILAGLLAERGYAVEYLEAGVDRLDGLPDPDLLVVLGGPIGVGDVADYPFLTTELAVIRAAIRDGVPLLGICLGAQLAAAALGAGVRPGTVEIGYAPIRLTDAGRASVLAPLDGAPVLHWHGDTFDLPDGAELLASTAATAHQAFTLGSRLLALQFHLEATPDDLERWLIGHTGELRAHGLRPGDLRADAARVGADLESRARRVLGDWLDGIAA